jgi:hypothetical protein
MKTQLLMTVLALSMVGCGKYIEVEQLSDASGQPVRSQPVDINITLPEINIVVEGDNINNSNTNNNTNSAEVDLDQDFDFNIELYGDEDYFERVRNDRTRTPRQCVDPQQGRNFLCHVYDFTGRNSLATQLAGAPHLGSFYMDKFDVTARDWQQGFPKFPASLSHLRENYAVRCFTKLRVTTAGMHTFSITSDDGMRVLLNNSPVVQDDGLHSPRTTSAQANLVKGLYNMEVQYFQGPRTQIAAELKWATPSNPTLRYIEAADTQKAKKLCQR